MMIFYLGLMIGTISFVIFLTKGNFKLDSKVHGKSFSWEIEVQDHVPRHFEILRIGSSSSLTRYVSDHVGGLIESEVLLLQ